MRQHAQGFFRASNVINVDSESLGCNSQSHARKATICGARHSRWSVTGCFDTSSRGAMFLLRQLAAAEGDSEVDLNFRSLGVALAIFLLCWVHALSYSYLTYRYYIPGLRMLAVAERDCETDVDYLHVGILAWCWPRLCSTFFSRTQLDLKEQYSSCEACCGGRRRQGRRRSKRSHKQILSGLLGGSLLPNIVHAIESRCRMSQLVQPVVVL